MAAAIMVRFYGDPWRLRDLALAVSTPPSVARKRWVRLGRPEDITGNDDILAAPGKYRPRRMVIVDGQPMSVIEAADRFLVTKQTVSERIRRYGIVLDREHLRTRQGQRQCMI